MIYFYVILLTLIATFWMIFGVIIASVDSYNGEIPTPRDFYYDGYNWFGSWFLFILRVLVGFPVYILGTIISCVCRFFSWLVRVGRK